MKKQIQLSKLLVTRCLLEDPMMIKLQHVISDDMHIPYAQEECIAHLIAVGEQLGLSGNLLSHYLIYALTHTPNIVSETIDRTVTACITLLVMTFPYSTHCFLNRPAHF